MPSKWIEHIKEFAKSNGMSYKDALKDPKCKSSYHEKGKGVEPKNNIEMKIEEVKKGRGRPKKYSTPEEAKKAKSVKTMESNKRKKAEKGGAVGMPNPLSSSGKGLEDIIKVEGIHIPVHIITHYLAKKALKAIEVDFTQHNLSRLFPQIRLLWEMRKPTQRQKLLDWIKGNPRVAHDLADAVQDIEGQPVSESSSESGTGLNAGYKVEAPNGLGHIYPISHELVLQMLKH